MENICDNFFTKKKIRVQFILSVFVFFIHISTLYNYDLTSGAGSAVLMAKTILTALARVAVPLFMIISGALFFRNYTYSATKTKIISRLHSLVIPYLIWNTIWMCFDLFCSYTPVSRFFTGRQPAELSWINVFQGIFLRKYNLPFWFIEHLILFTFICPITFTLIKNKKLGLVSLGVLAAADLFHVPFSQSYLWYCLGAYIGVHYFREFSKPAQRKFSFLAIPLLLVFILLEILDSKIAKNGAVLCIAGLLFWIFCDLIAGKQYFGFEKCSFLIYAAHINVSAVVTKLLFLVFPKNELFAVINFVATITITVFLIHILQELLDRHLPRLKILLCGR